MLLLSFLLATPCVATTGDDHAELHPADANYFLAIPDLRQLLDAYLGAPLVQLLDDGEVRAFAAKVVGEDPEQYQLRAEVLEQVTGALEQLPPQIANALSLLGEARSCSFSLSAPDLGVLIAKLEAAETEEQAVHLLTSGVGVLCFMDFHSAEAAASAAEMLATVPGTRAVDEADASPLEIRGASGVPRRLEIEGAPFGYWVVAAGNTVGLGLGSATPGSIARRLEDPSRSLAGRPDFTAADDAFLAPEGVTVYESWFHVDHLADLIHVSMSGIPDGQREAITSAVKHMVGDGGLDERTRSRLVGDHFVTETFESESDSDGSMLSFLGTGPIDAETISYLPGEAVGAWVTRMDPDELLESGMELVTRITGTDPGEALMMLERDFGLRPVEDIFQSLGTRCAVYVLPISGITIPKVHAIVELRDPAAFQRGLEGLGRMAEGLWGAEIQVESRPYRDVPLFTFAPKRNIGELAGDVGAPASVASLAPSLIDPELSIAVIGNRALIGISGRSNKREIKRLLDEVDAGAPAHALGGESSGVPDDATSAGYMDWGAIIGGFYASFRTLMPMIAQAAQELPFGPEDLPKADLFARHFRPSISWSRATAGGSYGYSESSFGPEVSMLGIGAGLAAALLPSLTFGRSAEVDVRSIDSGPPQPEPEAAKDEAARAGTNESLLELKLAIVMFQGEHGRHPESLGLLLEPSPNFPRGFLESEGLPKDGWDRAIQYLRDAEAGTFRLWSIGPDGVDQSGSGDDVTLN